MRALSEDQYLDAGLPDFFRAWLGRSLGFSGEPPPGATGETECHDAGGTVLPVRGCHHAGATVHPADRKSAGRDRGPGLRGYST